MFSVGTNVAIYFNKFLWVFEIIFYISSGLLNKEIIFAASNITGVI